jgi:hypothetical protein
MCFLCSYDSYGLDYVASMAWTLALYGLAYVTAYACFYDTSMLASKTHLWATIRGISLLVTNSPFQYKICGVWFCFDRTQYSFLGLS